MCGLLCFHNPDGHKLPVSSFLRALNTISHRGPDDQGVFEATTTLLGHRRLSILDLSTAGHQPYISSDSNVALVFNGQIYNFKELRASLVQLGYSFNSACDTEVVLNAYLQWGNECFSRFRGMWSIVIFDNRSKSLIYSRDRLGIKPLFVAKLGKSIVLSSEIKAILALRLISPEVDYVSLQRYITRGWLETSSRTFFEGISHVEPGTYTTITPHNSSTSKYWSLEIPNSPTGTIDGLEQQLFEAFPLHLNSDVPIAIALSGGIDSGLIASISSAHLRSDQVKAFSIVPPNTPSEAHLIDSTVKHLNINHEYVSVDSVDYYQTLADIIKAHDEPIPKVNHLYQYLIRKYIGDAGFKVMLSGEGADEICGGYTSFVPMYLAGLLEEGDIESFNRFFTYGTQLTNANPDKILKSLISFLQSGSGRRTHQNVKFGYTLFSRNCDPDDVLFPESNYHDILPSSRSKFLLSEMLDRYHVDIPHVLRIEDRNGMANSLEVRVPFLDHRLVEYGFSFAHSLYLYNGINKYPLRTIAGKYLPPDVSNFRSKYRRPGNDSYVVYEYLAPYLSAMLDGPIFKDPMWKPDLISLFNKDLVNQDSSHSFIWFRILNYAIWYSSYISRDSF